MKVAAVQMKCSPEQSDNFSRAASLIRAAAQQGAELVALPELFASLGRPSHMREIAEPLDGPTLAWAQSTAQASKCALIAGSFIERDGAALFNTSIAVGADGALLGSYRKIHLFDVDIEGARSKESDTFSSGTDPVVVDINGLRVGLTICYDLRFPELFRAEADQGADIIVVPAAFTEATGRDHWELLLRARAVENQTMIIAAAQWGTSPDGTDRHGHALIIDAWGRVLADTGPEGDTFIDAEFDTTAQLEIRKRLPALTHRRLNR
ncbi:MAG: carbon-nitrogen hydrolase family protein [Actinobacteria bacterium]|nr:carbon-nitrogen hydrolase family protein [Actinomycetota bacterium]